MEYKYINRKIVESIEEKLHILNSLRPLPKMAVEKLQEQFQIEMAYNSNAIEGNSLTLRVTGLVIHEGITIKGKPLKDHLEAKNQKEALEFLYDLVSHNKRHTVSEYLIRQFHQLVVHDTDKEWAGAYRNSNVYIAGASHNPPDAMDVVEEMKRLIKWINREGVKLHAIELAALFHHKLVHIHPFFDGNGRTARLLMNVLLMQKGWAVTCG